MLKLQLIILVLLNINVFVNSYIMFIGVGENKTKIELNEKVLSPATLGTDDVTSLALKFEEKIDQLDAVEDLPNLESFYLLYTDIDIMPHFNNLPKLESIQLVGHYIVYIKRGSISNTPVESVDLSYNAISVIESKSFGKTVKRLVLSCNKLRSVSLSWFQNIDVLEYLDMTGNKLFQISPGQFRNFRNLESITLDYNRMTSIGEGAFTSTRNFVTFSLKHNKLTKINPNVFADGIINIENFHINNNKLTFLSDELLSKLNVSKQIQVSDNPWQCKCWENLKEWLPDHLKFTRNDTRPVCVVPLSFSDYCVPAVDSELVQHYDKFVDPPTDYLDYICDRDTVHKTYGVLRFLSWIGGQEI